MKRKLLAAVLVLFSLFFGINEDALNDLLLILDPPPAGTARVIEVVDGDTIVVQFGDSTERVRLIGVDTPETHHPDKSVQCFGQAAANYLADRLSQINVRLEADPTNTNRDRYNRILRYVYLDNDLINLEIIRLGYGFAYVAFPFQKKDQFVAAQDYAQANDLGLWHNCEVEESDGFINTAPAVGG